MLDEVAIYRRALSQDEIDAHHAAGPSGLGYCQPASCDETADCPLSGNSCKTFTCVSNACVLEDLPAGTVCTDDGLACTLDECDGSGVCLHPDTCPAGQRCNRDVDSCQEADCPPDLLAYWTLDGSDPPFTDFGDGHDASCGNLSCPSPIAGRVGGALSFSEVTNTGLNIPGHADFDFGAEDSFSIAYWLRTDSASTCSGNQVVLGRDDSTSQLHWWTGCWDGGGASFLINSTSGSEGYASVHGTTDLTDGEWHHVVATFDGPSDEIAVYVDGNPNAEDFVTKDFDAGFAAARQISQRRLAQSEPRLQRRRRDR